MKQEITQYQPTILTLDSYLLNEYYYEIVSEMRIKGICQCITDHYLQQVTQRYKDTGDVN